MPNFRCRIVVFAFRLDQTLILGQKTLRCRFPFLAKRCFQFSHFSKTSISPRRFAHFHVFLKKSVKWFSGFLARRCGRCWYKVDILTFSQIWLFCDNLCPRLAHESSKIWFWSSEVVAPGRYKWPLKAARGTQKHGNCWEKWFNTGTTKARPRALVSCGRG